MLSRKQILAHVDKRIATVDVPELGGEIGIARLTVAEADKIRTLGEGGIPSGITIAILCCCDADGNRLFTAEDAEALMKMPADVIGAVATAALKHNDLTTTAQEEAKNGLSEAPSDASVSP